MKTAENQKPCVVPTARGFSVFYKTRYLFSKYDPQKNLSRFLDKNPILPNTLILCFSPVLPWTISHIQKKLYEKNIQHCFIAGIERDKTLYDFFISQFPLKRTAFYNTTQICTPLINSTQSAFAPFNFFYDTQAEFIAELLDLEKHIPQLHTFKRIFVIEGSGGAIFYKEFYEKIGFYAQEIITRFWKNRVTLFKLGRLYAQNIFKNLVHNTALMQKNTTKISLPILVLGAAPSVNIHLDFIRHIQDKVFIIAVDSVLCPLIDAGITPHILVAVETQFANEAAFIGGTKPNFTIYADLSSRMQIINRLNKKTCFFISEYAHCTYLHNIQQTLPFIPFVPPLGSVGLVAIELALQLRTKNTPIFFTGLDFAFFPGQTHCKEAPAQKREHQKSSRLTPAGNFNASFGKKTFTIFDSKNLITTPALDDYAKLFKFRFSKKTNLYNMSPYAKRLGCPDGTIHMLNTAILQTKYRAAHKCTEITPQESYHIQQFLWNEKNRLKTIKKILTGKIQEHNNDLFELLNEADYLYIHFPDGQKGVQLRVDFLKRVRIEVEQFLKILEPIQNPQI